MYRYLKSVIASAAFFALVLSSNSLLAGHGGHGGGGHSGHSGHGNWGGHHGSNWDRHGNWDNRGWSGSYYGGSGYSDPYYGGYSNYYNDPYGQYYYDDGVGVGVGIPGGGVYFNVR
jgi:hypothetical protein